jgi:FHS family L-fucose permease-like MFS transporter
VGIDNEKASYLLSASLFIFTVGRFAGTAIMKTVSPQRLLAFYAMVNIALCFIVVFHKGMLSVYALMAIFFFESIMFPTIFAMGVKQLGTQTKRGSSFIIMAIVGGAIMPYVMGWVADRYSTATSYVIPLCCFMVVVWYGWKGYRVRANT